MKGVKRVKFMGHVIDTEESFLSYSFKHSRGGPPKKVMRALVFENNKEHYFPESLRNLVRVPQVLRRLQEVQNIWNQHFDS